MAFMSFWKSDSTKLTLGPGLDLDTWDSIFGAGSYDAVQERGAKVISVQKAYVVNAVFRRCIEIRRDTLAGLPWGIYEDGVEAGDYKAALYTEGMASPPPELAVLRPFKRWLARTESSLAPTGRAYHLILRKAVGDTDNKMGRFDGLQYMHPHTVEPIIKAEGVVGYKRQVNSRQITLAVDAVFAIFEDDPYVEVGPGSSDGASATMNATSLYEVTKFLNRHLSTGLKKMTVLTKTTDARFTPEQKSELQRDWKAFMTRGTDRGAPPILNGVIPTVIGEGIKDLNDSKLNEDQAKFVAMGFGIPWAKYDNTANRSTSEVHERGFLTDTVIPQSDMIAAAFNEVLFPDYGLALRFEPERMKVFTSFELEKAESVEKLWTAGLINKNEGRLWIGQPDLGPDGEVFFSGAVSTSASAAGVPASDGRSPDRAPVEKRIKARVAEIMGEA